MSQGQFRVAKYFVAFDGQSLNYASDDGNSGSANDYPHQLMANYPNTPFQVVARGGASWNTLMDGDGDTPIREYRLFPYAKSGLTNILIMCGGTANYNVVGENQTGQQVYDVSTEYADDARTAGYDYVICCTTTPANYITGTQETRRQTGNGLVLADADSKFDYEVDLESGGFLSDVENATYYKVEGATKVHWTTAGATVAAGLVQDALDLIIPVGDR